MALNYVQLFQALLNKKEQERQQKEAQQQGWGQAIGTVAGGVGGFFLGGPPGAMIGATAGGQLGKVGAGGAYTPQDAASLITSGLGSLGAAQADQRLGQQQQQIDQMGAFRADKMDLDRDVAQNRLLTAGYSPFEFEAGVDAPENLAWLGEQAYQKLDTVGYDPASLEAMFMGTPEQYDVTATIPFGEKGRFTVKRRGGAESPEFKEPAAVAPEAKSRNLAGKARDFFATGTPALDETIASNYDVAPGLVRSIGEEFKSQTGRWPNEQELEDLVVKYLEL